MPNVNDLKQSRFLTTKDVANPILVTIKGFEQMNVARQRAEPDMRYVLYFQEKDKPMTLNVTNGRLIAAITGSENLEDWIGKKIILFFDPDVDFGGELVGGIRCRAPEQEQQEHGTHVLNDIPKEAKPMDKTMEIIDQAFFNFETENTDVLAEGFTYDKDRFVKAIVKHFKKLPTNEASIRKICDTVKPDEVTIELPTSSETPF